MSNQRLFHGVWIVALVATSLGSAWQFAAVKNARETIANLRVALAHDRQTLRELTVHRSQREKATVAASASSISSRSDEDVSVAMNESIHGLLQRVDQLKHSFETNPAQRIPEMRFLEEHDWLQQVSESALGTEEGARRFAAHVRVIAMQRFGEKVLKPALARYVAEHAGFLPTDISALAPLLAQPADVPILDRYEVVVTGPATTVAAMNFAIGLRPSSIFDPDYDYNVYESPQGGLMNLSGSPVLDIAVGRAKGAYANTHGGALVSDAQTLLPYFRDPADGLKNLEREKKFQAEIAARQAK